MRSGNGRIDPPTPTDALQLVWYCALLYISMLQCCECKSGSTSPVLDWMRMPPYLKIGTVLVAPVANRSRSHSCGYWYISNFTLVTDDFLSTTLSSIILLGTIVVFCW